MTHNKVSIILPTHNGAKYIRQSIESCLTQTYGNLELIIVDDASNDETPGIIRSYKDPRLKLITHVVNKKLPASLNAGFAASAGEYLTWASDDNYYAPNAIEKLASFLDCHRRVAFVYANYFSIDEHNTVINPVSTEQPQELVYRSALGPCFLYRRKVYEVVGDYDPHLFLVEDYDYWLRVRKHFRMVKINDYLCYYRIHSMSLSLRYTADQQAIKSAVRERYWTWEDKYYYRCIDAYFHNNRFSAWWWALVAFLMNPFNHSALRIMVLSLLPKQVNEFIRSIIKLFTSRRNGTI